MAEIEDLTYLEKCVVYYEYMHGSSDYRQGYLLLHPEHGPISGYNHPYFKEFKKSPKLQTYLGIIADEYNKLVASNDNHGRTASKRANAKGADSESKLEMALSGFGDDVKTSSQLGGLDFSGIDFTNRDEFVKFINVGLNTVKDDKLRIDLMKMMSDLGRFKETGVKKESEIQKFFVPLYCSDCNLYQRRRKELEEKGTVFSNKYVENSPKKYNLQEKGERKEK